MQIQKNQAQGKLEALEKEIQFINKTLFIQFGIKGSSLDYNKLDLESLKKVFEENDRLKGDIERLLDNIENSRGDIQRITVSNRAAVQGIPTILTQQLKATKDQYDS